MPVCLCRKCRHRSTVKKGSFPGVCPKCNYILTAAMIVDDAEGVELVLRNYCAEKGLNPDGQFIEEDGYLFIDGYELGRKAGKRMALDPDTLEKIIDGIKAKALAEAEERIAEMEIRGAGAFA